LLLKTSQEQCAHLTPFFSIPSALFCAMESSQPLSHQSLPHSFPCNGGRGGIVHPPIREICASCILVVLTGPRKSAASPLPFSSCFAFSALCYLVFSHTDTTVNSRNPFVLITMQIAGGWVGSTTFAGLKVLLEVYDEESRPLSAFYLLPA